MTSALIEQRWTSLQSLGSMNEAAAGLACSDSCTVTGLFAPAI